MAYDPRRAYDKATGKESLGRRIKRQRREAAAAEAAADTTTGTATDTSTDTTTGTATDTSTDTTTGTGATNLPVSTNTIPAWVDPAYGYNPNNPRKPNSAELTAAIAGINPSENPDYRLDPRFQEVSSKNIGSNLLYGVVGSNTDTRDWNAIMEAGKVSTGGPLMDTF